MAIRIVFAPCSAVVDRRQRLPIRCRPRYRMSRCASTGTLKSTRTNTAFPGLESQGELAIFPGTTSRASPSSSRNDCCIPTRCRSTHYLTNFRRESCSGPVENAGMLITDYVSKRGLLRSRALLVTGTAGCFPERGVNASNVASFSGSR